MAVISIREVSVGETGINATASFNHEGEYSFTLTLPFTAEDEAKLEWYFEEHLQFPFTQEVKARAAAASIKAYGEALFNQVFADRQAFAEYKAALQSGVGGLLFEIAGSPEFHQLHWEGLKDPDLPRPFALDVPMVRKNLRPQVVKAVVRSSPTINLLIVTSRPSGTRDVGYRTISRPLVEALRQSNIPVQVDIVRPGTYQELVLRLEAARDAIKDTQEQGGYYHVIHFDVHGAVLTYEEIKEGITANQYLFQTRYGRDDLQPYDGHRAFLFLEGIRDGQADLVEARELADLLMGHQVPIAILNACQSGKQVGASETSLGSRLIQSGAQLVLAMSYSVTVTAAQLLMRTLYEQLFAGHDLATAIRRGRLDLFNSKGRQAYFNQTIDLEDWLLPVVYQNRAVTLRPREFTTAERATFYERQARRFAPPQPTYGFIGRDLDILQIERHLLARGNILLVRGMGGAGKTTLLRHLGSWWQTTQLVDQVFSFSYDERAWTCQQILDAIAQQIYSKADYDRMFQPLGLDAQQALVTAALCGVRHLLILDNLESIRGEHLAIRHTLLEPEQASLHRFLASLVGGKTLVVLGSRSGEEWLVRETFGDNMYHLPGLDPESATVLAERVLERVGATKYRQSTELQQVLKLLRGYPLPIEVVLANLATESPAQVLEALQIGDVNLDAADSIQDKTRSILRCIDYSHSNLSPGAQGLLICLAPFTGVVNVRFLDEYTEQLRRQTVLATMPFDQWKNVLREATNWGLLAPHSQADSVLVIQPTLPYFLRSRLQAPDQIELRQAVETSFSQYYENMGAVFEHLITSKDADERYLGQRLIYLEYENLVTALHLALEVQGAMRYIYLALDEYWSWTQDVDLGIQIGASIVPRLEKYPQDELAKDAGFTLMRILSDIGLRLATRKRYEEAEKAYQYSLEVTQRLTGYDEASRAVWSANKYHQLGLMAWEQRQWEKAEQYYQQALQIRIKYNERLDEASTYHNLGGVAQHQNQWEKAEQYYQHALLIYVEQNERYEQASTNQQLGLIALEQGKWTQSEQYFQKALQIYVQYNELYNLGKVYHNFGYLMEKQSNWTQAEQYYQKALSIYIQFNDRYLQSKIYLNLGIIAQEQREWTQAEQYIQKALQLNTEYNDSHTCIGIYYHLGLISQNQHEFEQARLNYLEALGTATDQNDLVWVDNTFQRLAQLWKDTGDSSLPTVIAEKIGSTPTEVEERLRGYFDKYSPIMHLLMHINKFFRRIYRVIFS